jgi:TolB-like protein
MERKLAAILVADVAGYSSMMERDEAGTFERLRAHRKELVEPIVADHHGRVFKLTGDGLLAEFGSIVDAVECAAAIQRGMAGRNDGEPAERRIDLRIGVHVGDVIVEGEDRHGDAVNVAARLQQLAETGGICVSRTVVDQVRQKVALTFESRGEERLKNIAEPIKIFRVRLDERPAAPHATLTLPDKPSIAVLPFANMSGDPEQNYFVDGITEDIITELSRFHRFAVMARNSSFQYRDRATDVKRVGRELGVNYVVEGSVRKVGTRIRITAQLIDTMSGSHIWAERYDRDLEDIFAIQDEVVTTIVARLAGQVADAGLAMARRKRTDNLAAYDCLLRGYDFMHRGHDGDVVQACQMFERAIALDPGFAEAYAGLAIVLTVDYWDNAYRDAPAAAKLDRALEAADRAISLDSNDSICHRGLAHVHLARRSFDLADHHLSMGIAINPNDADFVAYRSWFEICAGRPDAALGWLDRAVRLNPHLPGWYWELRGLAYYHLRRYSEAAEAFDHIRGGAAWNDRFRAACYAQLGRLHEARAIAAAVLKRDPAFTLRGFAAVEPYQSAADLDHMIDGLRLAGLPE